MKGTVHFIINLQEREKKGDKKNKKVKEEALCDPSRWRHQDEVWQTFPVKVQVVKMRVLATIQF